jgi:2-polyprenyl-3-methyl-5-hydroxy-6-metoxy-1,4-benzoquinol methylase
VTHDEYYDANRANWSERVAGHWMADGYDAPGFIADQDRISGVVQFDHPYLGELAGRSLLHLQCHFGMDTLSMARCGAIVTGIDFSTEAIAAARRLSDESGTPGRFVETNLYLTAQALASEQFDMVYTGVGAINWLPDIARWGEVVATMLKPGGVFFMRECHPLAWSLRFPIEDPHDETLVIEYPYFEVAEPVSWNLNFGDVGSAVIENTRVYEWNHGIGEIMGALTAQGLKIDLYEEHRFLEWQGQHHMVRGVDGRWRLPDGQRDLVPLMYSLRACKA